MTGTRQNRLQSFPIGLTVACWTLCGWGSAAAPAEQVPAARLGTVLSAPRAEPQQPHDVQPDRVSVLVRMQPGANRLTVRAFALQRGGVLKHEYDHVLPDVVNLRNIPPAALDALRALPGVAEVQEDRYHANLTKLDEATARVRGLQSQVGGAGLSADGSGVRVCICDTGIDSDHLMYAGRIDAAAGWDYYNDDSDPEDDNGHGSHVAGIAVGGTGLSIDWGCEGPEDFQGVAPGATLIGVKILNQFGGGFDSDIIAGINRCADPGLPGGPADVINLSIGTGDFAGTCDGHSWATAANNAVNAGLVVVAASGNECNSNSMGSPACGTNVIAVGATYKDDYPNCEDTTSSFNWGCCVDNGIAVDDVVCFSNQSNLLDVSAPGSDIWSASTAAGGSSVTQKSGTSMSSPMVAGLAALILDADPSLSPAQVRQLIRDGAVDLGAPGYDAAYGYGRIDVINSLSLVTPCGGPQDCDDGDACTTDACSGGSCSHVAVNCDDGDACTTDSCDGPSGCANTTLDCDDADPCTSDSCNPTSGCQHEVVASCCGNGTCEAGEDCNSCAGDCIAGGGGSACGNGVCEPGEDCVVCSGDCNGKQNGNPGNRFCCSGDPGGGGGYGPVDCLDARCSQSGFQCGSVPAFCCGDGSCDGSEDSFSCALDCGAPETCGNGNCAASEDSCSCASDCGAPPSTESNCSDGVDNDCNQGTDCADPDCAAVPACQNPCDGDGVCEPGEDCNNCSSDCDSKTNGPPSGRYCCGNGVVEGPEADGRCDGNP